MSSGDTGLHRNHIPILAGPYVVDKFSPSAHSRPHLTNDFGGHIYYNEAKGEWILNTAFTPELQTGIATIAGHGSGVLPTGADCRRKWRYARTSLDIIDQVRHSPRLALRVLVAGMTVQPMTCPWSCPVSVPQRLEILEVESLESCMELRAQHLQTYWAGREKAAEILEKIDGLRVSEGLTTEQHMQFSAMLTLDPVRPRHCTAHR